MPFRPQPPPYAADQESDDDSPLAPESRALVVEQIAELAGISKSSATEKLRGKSLAACKNLRVTLGKFLAGRASQWEERKLQECGLIASPDGPNVILQDSDICDSYIEMSRRMMLQYQNADGTSKLRITLNSKTLGDWSHGKRLPAGVPLPPKPVEGVRRRWSLRSWIAWFNQYLWHHYKVDGAQPNQSASAPDGATAPGISFPETANVQREMPLQELEELAKRERLQHERWSILKEMGGYIAVPAAERLAAGFAREYHDKWKTRNEQTVIEAFEAKALALGVVPEIASALREFLLVEHRKFTDSVEDASERYAAELTQQIEAEARRLQEG